MKKNPRCLLGEVDVVEFHSLCQTFEFFTIIRRKQVEIMINKDHNSQNHCHPPLYKVKEVAASQQQESVSVRGVATNNMSHLCRCVEFAICLNLYACEAYSASHQ